MRPVDAAPTDLETVRRILREHAPELEVRAFGSRVSWTARETSDLDLALMTDEPLDAARMAVLRAAFTDSRLPFRVDVVDWAGVSDGFRKVIESEYVTLVGKGGRQGRRRWPRVTLGDCIRMNDSTYSPKEAWPFVNYLDTGNITENRVDGIHHLISGKDKIPSRARRKAQPGDILYSTVRPNQKHFGLLKEVPENFLASTGFSVFRGKAGIAHTGFIYWFLTQDHIVERLHTIAEHSTSAYPSIRPSDIEALTLALPPLPEQRAIAGVLGALDGKIDLNRRMNETLEAMARALFKSWFVDFDPVRAKAEGRDTGLPDHIADLFPDRLVDSELGEIPEGWMPRRLEECFALIMGQSPPGNTYNDHGEGLPFFQGRTDFGFRYPENRKFCTEPTRIARSGDTLVSVRAPVGDINMAWEKCCIGRGVAALRHKSDSISFTYYSVRSLQNSIGMYEHTGTVFGAINRKQFEAIQTLEPRSEVVETFDALASPLDCCIRNNVLGIRTLATLRDALLPKLVSGEVRLGEAVERLESAA